MHGSLGPSGPITATGNFDNAEFSGQTLFPAPSLGAPSIACIGDTNTGIHWPAADEIMIGGGLAGVGLRIDGKVSPGGPRSYIEDLLGTKATLTLTRGSFAAGGVVPDGAYTGGLMVTSIHNAGTAPDPVQVGGQAGNFAAYAVAGQGGFHLGSSGTAEATLAGTWNPAGGGLIGAFGQAISYRTGGRSWGSNFIAKGLQGDQSTILASEMGVEAQTNVEYRYGVQIVTLAAGNHSGTTEDIGLKFADKRDPTVEANLWDYAIGFGSPLVVASVGFPVKATGTLIKSFGTKQVARGIDFSSNSFSAESLRLPGNFRVMGSGALGLGISGTVQHILHVNAAATGSVMRFDNAATTAGAPGAGGGGALPATPSFYFYIQFDGTSYRVPAYPG